MFSKAKNARFSIFIYKTKLEIFKIYILPQQYQIYFLISKLLSMYTKKDK